MKPKSQDAEVRVSMNAEAVMHRLRVQLERDNPGMAVVSSKLETSGGRVRFLFDLAPRRQAHYTAPLTTTEEVWLEP